MHGVQFFLALPMQLADAAPPPLVPALFVGVFAALTALGYVLYFRTVAMAPPAAGVARTPPPEERARAALAAAAPLADIDVRAYYGCIAAAIRSYLSERYAVSPAGMVRNDVEKAMVEAGIVTRAAELAAQLLERCDGVQFAGGVPDPGRRAADLAAAQEIIDLTADRAVRIVPPGSDVQRPTSV